MTRYYVEVERLWRFNRGSNFEPDRANSTPKHEIDEATFRGLVELHKMRGDTVNDHGDKVIATAILDAHNHERTTFYIER